MKGKHIIPKSDCISYLATARIDFNKLKQAASMPCELPLVRLTSRRQPRLKSDSPIMLKHVGSPCDQGVTPKHVPLRSV